MENKIKITRHALDSALEVSKNTYPNEFIGMFRQKDGILTELIIAPLQQSDEHSAYFPIYAIPTDRSIVATFHSHPSYGIAHPSDADRRLFAMHYKYHFIATLPYTGQSTRAFDKNGETISFEIVD